MEKFSDYLDEETLNSNECFSEIRNIEDIIKKGKLDTFISNNFSSAKGNSILSNIKQKVFNVISKVKLLLIYKFNLNI